MSRRFSLKIKDHIDDPERKKRYNEAHFGAAAARYDFATRAMSLGRDGAWKRELVAALPALETPCCVDLATGTGDIALLLAEKYPEGKITGIDLTEPMLELARRRNRFGNLRFAQGDMAQTGWPESSVDVVTGSYAVRNAADIAQALAEIHRILKPGGVVALLDFSKSPAPALQPLQYALLKYWCGFWGLVLHGNPEIHAYIAASLKSFPDRRRLRELLTRQGFEPLLSRRYYFGLLEMIILRKPPST